MQEISGAIDCEGISEEVDIVEDGRFVIFGIVDVLTGVFEVDGVNEGGNKRPL